MQVFDYFINVAGNFSTKISGMTEATGKFSAEVKRSQGLLDSFAGAMAKIDVVCEGLSRIQNPSCYGRKRGLTPPPVFPRTFGPLPDENI